MCWRIELPLAQIHSGLFNVLENWITLYRNLFTALQSVGE